MKLGVLCGGVSQERDISLKSGEAVYNALLRQGSDVVTSFRESETHSWRTDTFPNWQTKTGHLWVTGHSYETLATRFAGSHGA